MSEIPGWIQSWADAVNGWWTGPLLDFSSYVREKIRYVLKRHKSSADGAKQG